jgi:general secretion pathway protein J
MINNKIQRSPGFTLLEILIALFIFTLVSIIMTGALHTAFNSQSATQKQAARLTQLQIALLVMGRDLEQTIDRSIITGTGATQGFKGSDNTVSLVRAGLTNPQGQLARPTLQRVEYEMHDSHLIRETWPVLDATTHTQSSQRAILDDVTALHFEYLDRKNHFQNEWPPQNSDPQQQTPLPKAVRVILSLKNWGNVSQMYIIPGVSNVKPPAPPK